MNDFGTGRPSLADLKRLRPSKIQIDRSVVKGLPDDDNDRVVDEGGETEAQHDIAMVA